MMLCRGAARTEKYHADRAPGTAGGSITALCTNRTEAELSNRVTSKEHFIVYVYSQKNPQKLNPQTGAKNKVF